MLRKLLAFTVLSLLLASCASKEKIVYFGNIGISGEDKNPASYEPKLKPDDLLLIIVSAPRPDLADLAAPFNLPSASVLSVGDQAASGGMRYQSYLVDSEGFIDFPIIGRIKMGGLLKSEAKEKLKVEIEKYMKDPIINMRINNYKVSVIGEVVRPGEIIMPTERMTVLEAISKAGDLTIYGNRKNILLIRDIEGVKTYTRIDITQADFLNSPQYYLQQNDMLYIEPNQTKVNSSVIGPNLTVAISAVSLLITIITLSTR
jgi:polysaccharide biosynthesis/export protein